MATPQDHPKKDHGDSYDDRRNVESMEEARDRVADIVKKLREDPKEFSKIREKLRAAETDDQRVDLLVDFAVTEERIASLVPSGLGGGGQALATVTTVTVTTVTIPDTAY